MNAWYLTILILSNISHQAPVAIDSRVYSTQMDCFKAANEMVEFVQHVNNSVDKKMVIETKCSPMQYENIKQ